MGTDARASLKLRLLGGFELTGADGQNLAPPGRKLRALIACLALPPGVAWSRERLMALLWGDRAEEQARACLRQALTTLRDTMGEPTPLRTDRETVALDSAFLTVDAVEFEHLARSGERDHAVEIYRGDLLDGVSIPDLGFQDWLLVERTRLHDMAVDVLARLLATQTGETAIETAQRLLRLEPAHEETHRALMRLYMAQGNRAQALRQYQICREVLQRELAVKPQAETEQLFRDLQSAANGATGATSSAIQQSAVPSVVEPRSPE